MLLLPFLKQNKNAAIINVTSGLAYVPHARMLVYSATKSALQSFTKSLRHQLKNDNIKVFEIAPPIVDTDLDKGAREKRGDTNKGIKPEIVTEQVIKGLEKDQYEIAIGQSKTLRFASRFFFDKIFGSITFGMGNSSKCLSLQDANIRHIHTSFRTSESLVCREG